MYNVCICVSKIPVIVLKSENKRLTCYIVSMTGSLGNNPAAPAMPAGFLCSFRESHYAAAAEETVLSVKDLCALTPLQIGSEWGDRVTGFFLFCSLQRGRFTPGERGPEVASAARRKTVGYRRRCSLMRVTHMWWHQWPVSMATVCWQWNVIFRLLPFCYLFNRHRDEM